MLEASTLSIGSAKVDYGKCFLSLEARMLVLLVSPRAIVKLCTWIDRDGTYPTNKYVYLFGYN
jgi:hypothetical protein